MVITTFEGSKLQAALERGDPRVKASRERFERVFRGTSLVLAQRQAKAQAEARAREEARSKAEAQARAEVFRKAQEQARKIQQQRLAEVRKIAQERARRLRAARTSTERRSIAREEAQRIRIVNVRASKEIIKAGFVNGLKVRPIKKRIIKKPIERKPFIKKAKEKRIKFPKRLDFPVPIFTAGAGSKSIKLKQITGGLFKELKRKGFSKERIASFTRLSDKDIDKIPRLTDKQKNKIKTASKIQQDILVGGLKEIEEHPEKIIVTTYLSTLAPAAVAKIGATPRVVKALKKLPKPIRKKGAKVVGKALTTVYLASAGLRIAKEPTPELKAQRAGRILAGEIVPFEIGTRFGVRGLLKQELQTEINRAVKGMSKQRQAAFKDYMKQAETFGKFEPKAKNIKLNNIESIPNKKAQKILRKFLIKSKGDIVVGGSAAQTAQIDPKRKLGDIDAYTIKGFKKEISNVRNFVKQLKKAGIKRSSFIVKKKKIEITIGGKKAIELHDIDRLLTNIKQVTPSWRNPKAYIIETPEGIRIQRVGLQARRKVVAAFADPKRLKTGKYKKDLKDFKKISDTIFKNAVKKSRGAFFFKKKRLRRIGKIFKRKIPKVKRIKIKKIKKFKKPKVLKKPVTKAHRKAKVIRGREKPKKISKKKIKKKFKPSQPKVKRKIKFRPSQLPKRRKKPKRVPPSQPPTKPPKKPPRRPPRLPPRRPPRLPPSQPPTKPPTRQPPPRFPPTRKPPKPPTKPPKKPPAIILKRKIKIRKGKKALRVFNVFGKVKGKFIKLNVERLTRNDALSKGAFAVDRTTARTFKIVPAGKTKKPGALLKGERNYFNRQGFKLREVKIRRGRKFKLKNKWIEKRKFGIDTRGEKKGLTIAKLLKQQRRGTKRIVKRRSTITKAKARKILRDKKIRGKPITQKQQRFFRSKVSKTTSKKKSSLSKAQLDALAKGRAKLKKMRRG